MIPIPDDLASAAWAQTWQVTLLIAAVALATRLVAGNRPHLAHALWLVVLLKLLTPPLLCSSGGVFCWMQATFQEEPIEVVSTAPPEPTEPLPAVAEMALPAPSAAGRILSASIEVDRTEEVWRPVATVPAVVIQTVEPAPGRLTSILLGVWFFGAFATLGVSGLRLTICLRRVRCNALPVDDAYRRMLDRLTRRLRLRRRVRLLITASRIGPAVVGLFRPTVILPEVVVRGKTPDELEPILAHELLHVRRGDLWVGALQTLARSVWWFHPMVWTADRLISREAERCCDEAVLGELGCSPSRYARSLFDVLERKQILKPLPAFPGVRPVEVTSRRLERIMSLGHGSHKRSPWWCWVVILLAAAVTLPGAALVVGADEQAEPKVLSPPIEKEEEEIVLPEAPSSDSQTEESLLKVYQVADLVALIRKQHSLSEEDSKAMLSSALPDFHTAVRGVVGAAAEAKSVKRSKTWNDKGSLVVLDTTSGHKRIAAKLDAWRSLGFRQITIESKIITLPVDILESQDVPAVSSWKVGTLFSPTPDVDLPFTFNLIHNTAAITVVDCLKNLLDESVQVLSPPEVTVFSGQTTRINGCTQRPFVVAVNRVSGKDGETIQPVVRVVDDGVKLLLKSELLGNGVVQLEFLLTSSSVLGAAPKVLERDSQGEPTLSIQVPKVSTSSVCSSVELRIGQTLVVELRGLKAKDADGREQAALVMLTPKEFPPQPEPIYLRGYMKPDTAGEPLRPAPAVPVKDGENTGSVKYESVKRGFHHRVYDVGDLITIRPNKIVGASDVHEETQDEQKPLAAPAAGVAPPVKQESEMQELNSLVELITTAIRPETWDEVGGPRRITTDLKNKSLVICQMNEAHEEIVDLLYQLRHLQEMEVQLDVEFMHVPREIVEAIGADVDPANDYVTLSPRETRLLRAFVEKTDEAGIRKLASTTTYNGQLAKLTVSPVSEDSPPEGKTISIQAVVNSDEDQLRLTLVVPPDKTLCASVPDGRTALFDVTGQFPPERWVTGLPTSAAPVADGSGLFQQQPPDWKNQRTFILVTPRTIVQEEEEQRLGIVVPFGMGTARIIIQEEEEDRLGITVPD